MSSVHGVFLKGVLEELQLGTYCCRLQYLHMVTVA